MKNSLCSEVLGKMLNELRVAKLFCDVYLVGDDQIRVCAHKVVLAAKSPVLRAQLIRENIDKEVVLSLKGCTFEIIEAFVMLLYMGNLNKIPADHLTLPFLNLLLYLCKSLELDCDYVKKCIDILKRSKKEYLEELLNSVSVDPVNMVLSESNLISKFSERTFVEKSFDDRVLNQWPLENLEGRLNKRVVVFNESSSPSSTDCGLLFFEDVVLDESDNNFVITQNKESLETKSKSGRVLKCPISKPHSRRPYRKNSKGITSKKSLTLPVAYNPRCSLNKAYTCKQCKKSFATLGNLKRHYVVVHEGKKDFQCHICSSRFGQKVTLDLHLMSVHKVIEGSQSKVDISFSAYDEDKLLNMNDIKLSSPMKSTPNQLFDVSKFLQSSDLSADSLLEEMQKDSLVNVPSTGSKDERTVANSANDREKKWKNSTTCEICNKQLSRPSNLQKHMLIHKASSSIVCKDPTNDQQYSESLITPDGSVVNKNRKVVGNGTFVCNHCNKKFLLAEYLKKHISVVHCQNKSFSCQACSKVFASAVRLRRHKIVHERKRCDRCDQVFEGQRAFSHHLKTSCSHSPFPQHEDGFLINDMGLSDFLLDIDQLTSRCIPTIERP